MQSATENSGEDRADLIGWPWANHFLSLSPCFPITPTPWTGKWLGSAIRKMVQEERIRPSYTQLLQPNLLLPHDCISLFKNKHRELNILSWLTLRLHPCLQSSLQMEFATIKGSVLEHLPSGQHCSTCCAEIREELCTNQFPLILELHTFS